MESRDYKSANCFVSFLSNMISEEAECLIGKKIYRVFASEYGIDLYFTDGSCLKVKGSSYGDSALEVRVDL